MNRRKVLVVDDDDVVVKALTLKLNASGFDVVAAADGATAVTAVRKEKPDLILLDITFPPDVGSGLWDGLRIMTWLKRLDEAAKIPVIVITNSDPAQYAEKAKSAGAAAFFHKGSDQQELVAIIRKALGETPAVA
jgi:CheY-like chemotaxis protein